MALFPQFPYSNLHELNLDWLIEQIRQIEGKGVVLSVNGLSGVVTLYTDKDVVFPDLGLEDNWQIYRLINDKVAGLKFTGEKFFYITKNVDDEEFTVQEVYTSNNQPPYPVTSVNGETGAVRLAGDTIPFQIDGSMTIEDVITPLEESIGPVIRYNKCNKGVSAGQYVYLIGSGIVGRTDGLYKAVNSVSANTVWTAADLQIMPNGLGGLVAENDSAISALNSKFSWTNITLENPSTLKFEDISYQALVNTALRLVFVNITATTNSTINAHEIVPLQTIDSTYAPSFAQLGAAEFIMSGNYHVAEFRKNTSTMIAYQCNEQTPNGATINGTIMWKY